MKSLRLKKNRRRGGVEVGEHTPSRGDATVYNVRPAFVYIQYKLASMLDHNPDL